MADSDCFIYGLVDPQYRDDLVRGLRYIGQSSVGMKRPKSHMEDWAQEHDTNKHKVYWVRKLKGLGLEPEIVVLARVALPSELDALEIKLIAHHKSLGCDLINLTEGGGGRRGFEHSEETRKLISDSKVGVSKSSTAGFIDVTEVLCDAWSPVKAWWLGAAFGRCTVDNSIGSRWVTFSSGSLELVEKWSSVLRIDAARIQKRADSECWTLEFGDVRLTEWLALTYGLDAKYNGTLLWPRDLPEELSHEFIRGLWDAKGTIRRVTRPGRSITAPRASLLFNSEPFILSLVAHTQGWLLKTEGTPASGAYAGRVYYGAERSGAKVPPFLQWVYANAPEPLRLNSNYELALKLCEEFEQLLRSCGKCGKPAVLGAELCRGCSKRKWENISCACGAPKIVAKGLCRVCYQRTWVKSGRAKPWHSEDPAIARLNAYAVPEWQKLAPELQKAETSKLASVYKGRGFPWYLTERPEEDPLGKVRKGSIKETDSIIGAVSWVGQRTCLRFHPHRLEAKHRSNMVSVAEAFDDPKWVERAIRLQLRHGDPVVPLRVYRAMSAILKGPLNFPPVLARWIVDKFAPENGVVLDPCAGYGGRLLGAVSSRRNITYVGYDVEPKTVEGNQKLAKHLEVSSRAGVELLGVEAVPEYPKADLVMTSPPYYNAEYYGSCAEITLQKYTSIREWLDGFLRVLIRKSLAAAPLFLLNIGAVKDCDLPEEAVRLATEEGFKLKARWTWQTATFGNVASKERLLLFER